MDTNRLLKILLNIAAETTDPRIHITTDEDRLIAYATTVVHSVRAEFTPDPEMRAFGASFAYVTYDNTSCSNHSPSELRRRADEQEDLLALIDSVFMQAHDRYNARTRDTLHAILADLSDESPELYAYADIVLGELNIIVSVRNAHACAEATLPISKLDLHCVCDAKIEYVHIDGPLPSNATPERLESRARTLRHLEGRLEEAFNRIAVAEECGSLQPN